MKKCLLFAVALFLYLFAFNQVTYYQASAYFLSGVTRTVTSTDTSATVAASDINAVLSKYGLTSSQVYPAFAEFNEADTLLLPDMELGQTDTIYQMDRAKIFTITVPDTTTRNNLITDLRNLSEVLFAEANGSDTETLVPNDPYYTSQWCLNNQTYPGHDIHAQTAWDIFTGSTASIIGIIDDGVDGSQTDLSNKITGGDNTFYIETQSNGETLSHGTAVAGAAAASTNNGTSIAGVDWNAKILPEDKHDYYLCFCLNYFTKPHGWNLLAKKTLAAVNFSPNVWTLNHSYELSKGFLGNNYSVVLAEAFAYAAKNNRVSCVAAGNDNSSSTSKYPANYNTQIIDVGASDEHDNRTSFSNYGANLDVVAPGLHITSLNYTHFGSLLSLDGTSLSSPIVAGIASLLKGYNNNLYNDDIEQLIKISADDILPAGRDDYTGYGRVNASIALNYLKSPSSIEHFTAIGGTAYSTSNMPLIILGASQTRDGHYQVLRTEVRKTITLPNNYCSITGVWGTGLKTTGWHDNQGYCYGDGFCEVVPGSLTSTQVTLRTYVYQTSTLGILGKFRPQAPQNVTFAYSVLGITGPTNISGDNSLCTTSGSYTLPNLPAGATVHWSVYPSLVTINSPNSTQTTLSKIYNGNITLTATISNTCGGQATLSKQIYVGTPIISATYNDNSGQHPIQYWTGSPSSYNSVCNSYDAETNMDIQGGTNVTWSKVTSNPTSISWNQSGYNIGFYFWLANQTAVFKVDASNNCGITTNTFGFKSVDCSGGGGGGCDIYQLSPNPASSSIQVGITPNIPAPCGPSPVSQPTEQQKTTSLSKTGSTINRSIQSIIIYDNKGALQQQHQYSAANKTATLNVSSLPAGIYIVRITDGAYTENHRVVIGK